MTAQRAYVVSCGRDKQDHPAAARDLYISAHFQFQLAAVEGEAHRVAAAGTAQTRVLILSALHGLLDPDTIVGPYDVTIFDTESITADRLADQLSRLPRDLEIHAFLGSSYLSRLEAAVAATPRSGVVIHNAFAGTTGIGQQRHILARLGDPQHTGTTSPADIQETRSMATSHIPGNAPAELPHLWEVAHPHSWLIGNDDDLVEHLDSFDEMLAWLEEDKVGSTSWSIVYRWSWIDRRDDPNWDREADPLPEELVVTCANQRRSAVFHLRCPISKDQEPQVREFLTSDRALGALRTIWAPLIPPADPGTYPHLRAALATHNHGLPARTVAILRFKFGLDDNRRRTSEEVCRLLLTCALPDLDRGIREIDQLVGAALQTLGLDSHGTRTEQRA